jgi:aryl-alcohol dehydrogenase-like predicted oxidoreductase
MDYLALGQTGLKVSRLCLGCMSYGSSRRREWILDEEQSFPFFKQAIEGGINFFDTADMYSGGLSEEVTGRALKKLALRREEIVIATKLYYPIGLTVQTNVAPRRSTFVTPSTAACDGWGSTMSICTRSIVTIGQLRWKKR